MGYKETKKNPKYTIKNLSKEGEIYEISFIQKSSEDIQSRKMESIEPIVEEKPEDIFLEKPIVLEPVDTNERTEVIYEEPVKKRPSGIFYNLIGKYFLCCQ
ncbi:hypothetical protein P3W45_001778 [Vairimorpha bombi]|jgi:hypothetical protein